MSELPLSVGPAFIEKLATHLAEQLEPRLSPPREPYLNADEAAEYLACSRRRIYDLVECGAVNSFRDGRRLLLKRSDLDAYVDERRT